MLGLFSVAKDLFSDHFEGVEIPIVFPRQQIRDGSGLNPKFNKILFFFESTHALLTLHNDCFLISFPLTYKQEAAVWIITRTFGSSLI